MKWWSLFLFCFLLISCAGGRGMGGIKCMKNKPRKSKKYRVKKLKPYPPVYSVSGGSSSQKSASVPKTSGTNDTTQVQTASINQNEQAIPKDSGLPTLINEEEDFATEEPMIAQVEQDVLVLEVAEVESIAPDFESQSLGAINQVQVVPKEVPQLVEVKPIDSEEINQEPAKINSLSSEPLSADIGKDKPDVILSFREQEVNITEGYSFNELIPFVINKDKLLSPEEAYEKIEDLATLLIENPQVQVTIIANTATDEPHPAHKYGSDEETLTTMWEKESTAEDRHGNSLKELMTSRGKKIKELLIERGVQPEQLSYRHGAHYMWKYQRFVTFVLNEVE